jgi:hypothetical protein
LESSGALSYLTLIHLQTLINPSHGPLPTTGFKSCT